MRLLTIAATCALAALSLPAQEAPATHGRVPIESGSSVKPDIITPHITDSHEVEWPCFNARGYCAGNLPHLAPVHIGPLTIDVSPTKHVVMLLIASGLCLAVMLIAARAATRHRSQGSVPGGLGGAIEAAVLYLRNEVILPNVGAHGQGYVPFLLTLFFFILFANLLGLIPYGSTATGNISVTATLAIVTFLVIEVAGMRAQGVGYLNTIVYWPHDLSLAVKVPMTLIMTPVEIIAKFTKPFALAIRLFANMTAGHVVLLALISLIFVFASPIITVVPLAMGVAVSMLELFVAFLQAFIFCLLSSVFIGQIRASHH